MVIVKKKKRLNRDKPDRRRPMNFEKYRVNEECISCRACVEIAGDNFDMDENDKAYVRRQPESSEEVAACEEALEACPVRAIVRLEEERGGIHALESSTGESPLRPLLARDRLQKAFEADTGLLPVVVGLSPYLQRLHRFVPLQELAPFLNLANLAAMGELSLCEVLHTLNRYLGVEEELVRSMPACIGEVSEDELGPGGPEALRGVEPSWPVDRTVYIYNPQSMPEILKKLTELPAQGSLSLVSDRLPVEVVEIARGLGFAWNLSGDREYNLSLFNPKKRRSENWLDRRGDFEVLDVRRMNSDPFDIIIKKAYETSEDGGFALLQRFEPLPLIRMLDEMGFEHHVEKLPDGDVRVYFHRRTSSGEKTAKASKKTDVVIQSATPVAYPVIMRLLQSERIRKAVNIRELKVWEETEKHLAWIANGKADISFTALITAAKLSTGDIKIPALFVWDNFVILTRGYAARDFRDLVGKKIHTPLFEEAPPTKITQYLIKKSGLDPVDFHFVYGKPFGRPGEIFRDFVTGKADTVMLREPEASYALKSLQDRGEEVSVVSYAELWNRFHPGFGSFPNAGILFKGDFARRNPVISRVFLEELKAAIDWVNSHRKEAAKLSFDMMRQPVDRIELFLDRVTFDYVEGAALRKKVEDFFTVLNQEGMTGTRVTEEFLDIFGLDNEPPKDT
jgi:NitT/TauT family transport system substrate-binding protein